MIKNISKYIPFIIGEGLSKGIIFLLFSFYTTYFDKIQFGKLALYWSAIPVLSVFIDFAQRSYVKNRALYSSLLAKKTIYVTTIFSCVISLAIVLILGFLHSFDFYIIDSTLDTYIVICAFLFSVIELFLSLLQIKGQVVLYNLFYGLRNALPYIITFFIAKLFQDEILFDASIYPLIQFIVLLIIVLILFILVFRKNLGLIKVSFYGIIKKLQVSLKFSFPIIPGILSALILSFSDRFVINYFYGEVEVAEYTVAYVISSIFMATFMATNKMWQKVILERLKLRQMKQLKSEALKYALIILLVGISIVLFRDTIIAIIANESYFSISYIVLPIVIGMYFYFLFTVLSNIPFFYKDTFLMSVPAIIAAILNLLLNFIFIPKYGFQAAAYTTMGSYFIQFLVIYFICRNKYKFDLFLYVNKN